MALDNTIKPTSNTKTQIHEVRRKVKTIENFIKIIFKLSLCLSGFLLDVGYLGSKQTLWFSSILCYKLTAFGGLAPASGARKRKFPAYFSRFFKTLSSVP
jgi:hypothetical protein